MSKLQPVSQEASDHEEASGAPRPAAVGPGVLRRLLARLSSGPRVRGVDPRAPIQSVIDPRNIYLA